MPFATQKSIDGLANIDDLPIPDIGNPGHSFKPQHAQDDDPLAGLHFPAETDCFGRPQRDTAERLPPSFGGGGGGFASSAASVIGDIGSWLWDF